REVPDREGDGVVGDELGLAEAGDRTARRGRGPERQHDERHRGREEPDQQLGAIGHDAREAYPHEGGPRPEEPPHFGSASRLWRKTLAITSLRGGSSTRRS